MARKPGRGIVRDSQGYADTLADEAYARCDAVWVITTRASSTKDGQTEYGIAGRGHPDLLAALLDHADCELCEVDADEDDE